MISYHMSAFTTGPTRLFTFTISPVYFDSGTKSCTKPRVSVESEWLNLWHQEKSFSEKETGSRSYQIQSFKRECD